MDLCRNPTPAEGKTEKAPPFTTERPLPHLNVSPYFEIPIASKARPQNPRNSRRRLESRPPASRCQRRRRSTGRSHPCRSCLHKSGGRPTRPKRCTEAAQPICSMRKQPPYKADSSAGHNTSGAAGSTALPGTYREAAQHTAGALAPAEQRPPTGRRIACSNGRHTDCQIHTLYISYSKLLFPRCSINALIIPREEKPCQRNRPGNCFQFSGHRSIPFANRRRSPPETSHRAGRLQTKRAFRSPGTLPNPCGLNFLILRGSP